MPNLSQTTIVIIVVAVVLLGAVIIMGRRLRKFTVTAGGIKGRAEAGTPGANVSGNVVEGDLNRARAGGENASITHNEIKGSGNEFTAKTVGKDDDPP
jgi:hypothetical protein